MLDSDAAKDQRHEFDDDDREYENNNKNADDPEGGSAGGLGVATVVLLFPWSGVDVDRQQERRRLLHIFLVASFQRRIFTIVHFVLRHVFGESKQ